MKVPIDELWMSPCTLLVARELAVTLPEVCLVGMASGTRSAKLVSVRLNAVVCELAMLPEMFCSACDCARMPETAVVRASKIPITVPQCVRAAAGSVPSRGRSSPATVASLVPVANVRDFNRLEQGAAAAGQRGRAGFADTRQDLPGRGAPTRP